MRYTLRMILSPGVLALLGVLALFPARSSAQTAQRCFPETGHCINGAIRAYWERFGGLPVFGYPISAVRTETVEGRWTGRSQPAPFLSGNRAHAVWPLSRLLGA
jgi:hypothetical protein